MKIVMYCKKCPTKIQLIRSKANMPPLSPSLRRTALCPKCNPKTEWTPA